MYTPDPLLFSSQIMNQRHTNVQALARVTDGQLKRMLLIDFNQWVVWFNFEKPINTNDSHLLSVRFKLHQIKFNKERFNLTPAQFVRINHVTTGTTGERVRAWAEHVKHLPLVTWMLHLNSKTNTINRPDVIVDVKYLKIPSQAAAQVGGYCGVKRLIP